MKNRVWIKILLCVLYLLVNIVSIMYFNKIIYAVILNLGYIVLLYYLFVKEIIVDNNYKKEIFYDDITSALTLSRFKVEAKNVMKNNELKKFVIIKIDIVNYKAIKETFGEQLSDELIKSAVKAIKNIDEKTLLVARNLNSEIFAIAAGGVFEDINLFKKKFEEVFKIYIKDLKKKEIIFRYARYYIDINEGINAAISKVNMAHNFAKDDEGENISDYNEDLKQVIIKQTEITNKMQRAIENKDFKLLLQPQFRLSDNEVVAAEALVRWQEQETIILPSEFIPVFEKNGFIMELDLYMLREVCSLIRNWLDIGKKCVPIAINFSRLNIKNENFIQDVKDIIKEYGVPIKYIEIEITENLIAENETKLKTMFNRLADEGIAIAIDDFGTAQSSLSMLRNYNATILKLDKSFFESDGSDKKGNIVVKSVINLANELNMKTVAEGIEDKSLADFLNEIGCYAAQGYLFSKPITPSDFAKQYL